MHPHYPSPVPTPQRRSYMNRSPYTPMSPYIIRDESQSISSDEILIYGTTINQNKLFEKLRNFVREYESRPDHNRTYYAALRIIAAGDFDIDAPPVIRVDARHIYEYDIELYSQLVHYPIEVIITMDQVFCHLLLEIFSRSDPFQQTPPTDAQRLRAERIMTEIYGLVHESVMRKLNPQKEINNLISIKGFVTRCSDPIPQMKKAMFVCSACKNQVAVDLISSKIDQPSTCSRCNRTFTMEISHSQCVFSDKQIIKLQELPEVVPEGETPQSVTLIAYDHNTDKLRPGDKVEVVGIFRSNSRRVMRNMQIVHSVYETYLDAISFELLNKDRFKGQEQEIEFSEQEIREFHILANDPKLYDKLIQSVAPNIWQLDSVKKGILCQLFGGSKSKLTEGQSKFFRSGLHILLVGDPSTAKSQMLKYVSNVAPRVIYTTGRGSSAMGLTAAVTKDPDTNEFIMESGALVLADKGICCLDEFDKMNESSRTVLLESMEQQTISVAKAGIVCQLNSRTSILAAANPIHSMYDPKKTIVENINMPSNLLARFDLIYLLIDKPDRDKDLRLATHILNLFGLEGQSDATAAIPRSLLTNYISYAKKMVHPQITASIAAKISQAYVEMRKLGITSKTVTATPRQLDSMIRISESLARMRLSGLVQERDVNEAVQLINEAMLQTAVDPSTGRINMDQILLGTGARTREREATMREVIEKLLENNQEMFQKGINLKNLLQQIRARLDDDSYTQNELRPLLAKIVDENKILMTGNKSNPIVRLNATRLD